LLVSCKTSVTGNVDYQRTELEAEHIAEDGTARARWETAKRVEDPAEHEAAIKVRGRALGLIRGVCARSAFGLLCPNNKEQDLADAIRDARTLADQFNATAKLTRIGVYVIAGRVAQDDAEAARAIKSEVAELIALMSEGIKALDVQAVRDAANRAKNVSQMLTPESQERVKEAIDLARTAARTIVKAGEQAATEIDAATLRRLEEARTGFLDLDEGEHTVAEVTAASRALDFEPIPEEEINAAPQSLDPLPGYDLSRYPRSIDEEEAPTMTASAPYESPRQIDLF
jgi:hypothetical protein